MQPRLSVDDVSQKKGANKTKRMVCVCVHADSACVRACAHFLMKSLIHRLFPARSPLVPALGAEMDAANFSISENP